MSEITQSPGGLNFTAAIFKFTRLKLPDLHEASFVANLLLV
nr:hypothetical protein [uncultured Campylobacter sp.]